MVDHALPDTPPSRWLFALESRALWEWSFGVATSPWLRLAPRGDGHPVLVLPGFTADDRSTSMLRRFLASRGYQAHGWGLGANRGPRPGVRARVRERLDELAARHGREVSLIGWSLGGIYARELAWEATPLVRSVITLGSMFAGGPNATNVRRVYEGVSGCRLDEWPNRQRMLQPPPVPSTSIYSRSDGIVAWQACLEQASPASENLEVESSHGGLGWHPAVLYAIAERLAQPKGQWQPFERRGWRAFVYPDPRRGAAGAAVRA